MVAPSVLVLAAGIVCAAAGGELFVRATVGVAQALRVAPAIVATTVVAFATSSPELSVAVNAGLAGEPAIALGNAVGANVVNIALTLGIALCVAATPVRRRDVQRDLGVAMLVPAAIAIAALDGSVSRADAAVLATGFAAWLAAVLSHARRQRRDAAADPPAGRPLPAVAALAAGLGLLVVAGHLVVEGGTGIAAVLGLDDFVVGATVVAIGTTMPELATSIVAVARGRGEIGLGTILGSNVFNGLVIVPAAALLAPIVVDARDLAIALGLSLASLLALVPGRGERLGRGRGAFLLALYAVYLAAMLGDG